MNDSPSNGKTYWKSFEELSRDPAVMEQIHHEFEPDYDVPTSNASAVTRRTFMGLLGASMALAATGCRRPEQKIVPYVKKPEYLTPGIANHFASSLMLGSFAHGVLVRSREGRPVKIEGNDLDPVSRGKSTAIAQAALLSLYDPDRVVRPTVNNSDSTPQNAIDRMAMAIRDVTARGKQVWIMTDEHASPSRAAVLKDLETVIPNCRVVTWPGITATGAAEAARAVLGVDATLVADLSKADVILGVDADFLGTDVDSLWHIRNFAAKRRPSKNAPVMSRFHAVESAMTMTGTNADTRTVVHPSEINAFLLALLHELVVVRGRGGLDAALVAEIRAQGAGGFPSVKKIAGDLAGAKSVVMIGRHLPAETHALGILLNSVIGAFDADGAYGARHALPYSGARRADMDALRAALTRGEVGVLLFADVNAAYALPSGAFRTLTSKVQYRFAASQYADETSKFCQIFIPVAHALESWGDTRSLDGSQSVAQPLIAPLNEGQLSLGDVLLRLGQAMNAEYQKGTASWHDYVMQRWQREVYPSFGGGFPRFWEETLRTGTVATPASPMTMSTNAAAARTMLRAAASAPRTKQLVVGVLPSHALYDGRNANLGWLQELPDPVTKITWDNAAIMNRATAGKLGVKRDDVVRVKTKGGSIELPVFLQPGVADDVVVTHTGYGRSEGGRVLDGVGANAFLLMPAGYDSVGYVPATVEATGRTAKIATTQNNFSLGGDDTYGIDRSGIVKEGTLAQLIANPAKIVEDAIPVYGAPGQLDRPISLVPGHDYSKGHRWGMTIDTTACVGCNACVTACYAENNIPVVGKDQVLRGRHMAWIRIDRYYAGDEANPRSLLQPMLCQHCENAPCENVCPVAATTHSPEGLNEMTYNRCVGTRYCSNNCPYKVRRFNFLDYHKEERDPVGLVYNPDVTVRMRGVMEKCTFCVQRLNEAKYHAKNEGLDLVADGTVQTACQQACPADAIVFGNTNDAESRVAKARTSERGYHVLRELNVLPSITYLARIRNTDGGNA